MSSPGLPRAAAVFYSRPAAGGPPRGVPAREENRPQPIHTGRLSEIPLRKIELTAQGERILTPECREVTVRAGLYPAGASYPDLSWRVVNPGGTDSHMAEIVEVGEGEVRLRALGDGKFRLRCLSKNGTDQVRLFAELEFTAEGLGVRLKIPTDSGGSLYDAVVGCGTVTTGVATARGWKPRWASPVWTSGPRAPI